MFTLSYNSGDIKLTLPAKFQVRVFFPEVVWIPSVTSQNLNVNVCKFVRIKFSGLIF